MGVYFTFNYLRLMSFCYVESIIPVCPPACGQARYGDAATITASTSAQLMTLLIIAYRYVFLYCFKQHSV